MPVYMFHSIGDHKTGTYIDPISIPVASFDNFCSYLKKKKIKTGFLDDWLVTEKSWESEDHVYLTFDDGFLDFWINVFPILKKYNLKATLFINPEFVVEGKAREADKIDSDVGYLNTEEIILLHESGLVEIESHSMSHTWYPVSSQIIDFYSQNNYFRYPWMNWNLVNNEKHAYFDLPYRKDLEGKPVFNHGRSLGIRRYIPNPEAIELSVKMYKKGIKISQINERIFTERINGHIESDKEMIDRYNYELKQSKLYLEKILNKEIIILCWPGGSYNDVSVYLSRELGYQASTVSSQDKSCLEFPDYRRIHRRALSVTRIYNGMLYKYTDTKRLIRYFRAYRGSFFDRVYVKLNKKTEVMR